MFCKNCGNKFQEDEKFCGKCGHPAIVASTEVKTSNENLTTEAVVNKDQNLKGLGGWLIIVVLGLFYTVYAYGSAVISSIKLFTDGTVDKLSSIQGYSGALSFEILIQALIALSAIFLIYLFFKENEKFPKFYIILLVVVAIFIVIDNSIISSLNFPTEEVKNSIQGAIQDGYTQLGRAIISGIIWIWYMRVSKRVKLTFVKK